MNGKIFSIFIALTSAHPALASTAVYVWPSSSGPGAMTMSLEMTAKANDRLDISADGITPISDEEGGRHDGRSAEIQWTSKCDGKSCDGAVLNKVNGGIEFVTPSPMPSVIELQATLGNAIPAKVIVRSSEPVSTAPSGTGSGDSSSGDTTSSAQGSEQSNPSRSYFWARHWKRNNGTSTSTDTDTDTSAPNGWRDAWAQILRERNNAKEKDSGKATNNYTYNSSGSGSGGKGDSGNSKKFKKKGRKSIGDWGGDDFWSGAGGGRRGGKRKIYLKREDETAVLGCANRVARTGRVSLRCNQLRIKVMRIHNARAQKLAAKKVARMKMAARMKAASAKRVLREKTKIGVKSRLKNKKSSVKAQARPSKKLASEKPPRTRTP